jgi:hypothetical protein
VNEERILDKLDSLEGKTTDVLVALARVEEQIKDVPGLKDRVSALERWRWTAMGALGTAGVSLASQLYQTLKGA